MKSSKLALSGPPRSHIISAESSESRPPLRVPSPFSFKAMCPRYEGKPTYAGQFSIMAAADHDACSDLDVLTAAAQDELQALAAAT